MLKQAGQMLKIVCLVLTAAAVYELALMIPRVNPLAGVAIPALPTLAADTNSAPPVVKRGTNAQTAAASNGASKPADSTGTNSLPSKATNGTESNQVTIAQSAAANTNAAPGETNGTTISDKTNMSYGNHGTHATKDVMMAGTGPIGTNSATNLEAETNLASTNNSVPQGVTGTNGSNSMAVLRRGTNGTNVAQGRGRGTNGPGAMARAGMALNGRGAALPELPPDIKARVDRVYESEILGQVMRPLPMALIGIAGDFAILRSPTGQTGLVKEGDSLGELKLVRIGINRVLVELSGKKQELMIFEGYGGTSLMPQEKENSK